MDVSTGVKAEPMESSELDHELYQFQLLESCNETIKSEPDCDHSACTTQNCKSLPLILDVKTEEFKLEDPGISETFIDDNCKNIKSEEGNIKLFQFATSSTLDTVQSTVNTLVNRGFNIHLDVPSNFEESDFETKPFQQIKLENDDPVGDLTDALVDLIDVGASDSLKAQTSLKTRKKKGLSTNKSNKQVKRCTQNHYNNDFPRKKCTCTQNFVTQKQVDFHMWIKHRKEIPDLAETLDMTWFTCDICKYKTMKYSHFKTHKLSHCAFEGTNMYSCSKCSYESPFKSTLTRHFKRMHSENRKAHKCKYCNKTIAEKHNLADHLLTFHDDKIGKGREKMFTYTISHCRVCDFRTVTTRKLKRHMVQQHSDVSKVTSHRIQFKCKYCDEEYDSQIRLDSHLVNDHEERLENIEKELEDRIFSCELCSYKTVWDKYFKNHVKRQHGSKSKKCPLCDKSSYSRSLLGNHILRKHQSEQGKTLLKTLNYKVYTCTICTDYQTVMLFEFKEHMYKAHNEKSYFTEFIQGEHSCLQCGYTTPRKSNLYIHMRAKHSSEKPFRCLQCNYKTTRKDVLNSHVRVKHCDENPFVCSYCKVSFKYNETLNSHLLKKHMHTKHSCTQCEYKTSRKSSLDSHVLVKHSGEKPFRCSQCEYNTHRKSTLKTHIYVEHSDEKLFSCSYCDYSCNYKDRLNSHLLKIHMVAKYSCSHCEYKTYRKSCLDIHVRVRHSGENPFSCSYCDQTFKHNESLNAHLLKKHMMAKHSCSQCEYKTSRKSSLNRHVRVRHSGEKRYSCSYCNHSCNFKESLDSHLLKVHMQAKLSCSQCDYKTSRKSTLNNHIRITHSGEKPFSCSYCNYTSHYKHHLAKHVLKKHNGNVIPPEGKEEKDFGI